MDIIILNITKGRRCQSIWKSIFVYSLILGILDTRASSLQRTESQYEIFQRADGREENDKLMLQAIGSHLLICENAALWQLTSYSSCSVAVLNITPLASLEVVIKKFHIPHYSVSQHIVQSLREIIQWLSFLQLPKTPDQVQRKEYSFWVKPYCFHWNNTWQLQPYFAHSFGERETTISGGCKLYFRRCFQIFRQRTRHVTQIRQNGSLPAWIKSNSFEHELQVHPAACR